MKDIFKKIPKDGLPIILCVLIAIAMIYSINLRIQASSIGSGIGSGTGSIVGKAVGSFEGMGKGITEGTKAGKEEALSAEETVADISNRIQKSENLEVLVASVKLTNFHTIGKDYAALYLANGNVVFTVDMSKAEVRKENKNLYITLPKPAGNLYIDNSSISKVAEYQRKIFNGSAEDGFDAYLNTLKKVQAASEETLDNYDALLTSAEDAAERQVTLLAEGVSTDSDQKIIVTFTDEEE